MAVSEADVRHVAALARLGLSDQRVQTLAGELNNILEHMDVLSKVRTDAAPVEGVAGGGMPLRADTGPAIPLARPLTAFVPSLRDGFITVPRLDTHGAPAAEGGE